MTTLDFTNDKLLVVRGATSKLATAPAGETIAAAAVAAMAGLTDEQADMVKDGLGISDQSFASALSTAQKAQVSVSPWRFGAGKAKIAVTNSFTDDPDATLFVATKIADASGGSLATKMAGIFSYLEQTGTNTFFGPKAICGVSVNAAAGNNDSTGVVGYSYKLDVAGGIGDCAGAGGACHQYSGQEGLALGAEFSVHQHVSGTFASPNAHNGNNSMAIHVTTASDVARAWAAIGVDAGFGLSGGYGYWNGIVLSRSMFAAGSEGMGQVGTVGINFGNNTLTGPEKAIYLGNAEYHLWRPGTLAIRSYCSSFDIENVEGSVPGVRVISPLASPQGGYFGAYKGISGPDGSTALTTMGAFIVDSANYAMLAAYDAAGNMVSKAGVSPSANAFIPLGTSGEMSLGAASRLWSQVFASTPTISTSDERVKTPLLAVPDAVLDAWGEVSFGQFKFLDAEAEKGSAARLHTGVIAQRVVERFAAHGVDATAYGLLCHDTWEAEPERVTIDRVLTKHAVYEQVLVQAERTDANGEVHPAQYRDGAVITPDEYQEIRTVTPAVPAGDRYGIRYEEALALEAAYQRRRADRLEAALAAITARVAAIETKLN